MDQLRTLTFEEKRDLARLVCMDVDTIVLLHGEGEHRQISFYAKDRRNEARIAYPEVAK